MWVVVVLVIEKIRATVKYPKYTGIVDAYHIHIDHKNDNRLSQIALSSTSITVAVSDVYNSYCK
jgi:hypothetical protein